MLVNCRPEGSNAIHGFPSSPSLTVNLKSALSVVILVLLFTLSHFHTSTVWIILSWNCDCVTLTLWEGVFTEFQADQVPIFGHSAEDFANRRVRKV